MSEGAGIAVALLRGCIEGMTKDQRREVLQAACRGYCPTCGDKLAVKPMTRLPPWDCSHHTLIEYVAHEH